MTQFVTVQFDRDKYELDPDLYALVAKLVITGSALRFRPQMDKDGVTNTADASRQKGIAAPAGKKFLRKLCAYDGDDQVGAISVDTRWSRSKGSIFVYNIESWRINKSRGSRNVSHTTDLSAAVRLAKRNFIKRNDKEAYEEHAGAADMGFVHATQELSRPIVNGAYVSYGTMQLYLYNHINGYAIPPSVKKKLEETMTSDRYKKAMSEYLLAEGMRTRLAERSVTIVVLDADTFLYRETKDGKAQYLTKSFDELPETWKDKLSVLRFAKDKELVRDAGYRHSDKAFVILP
jgi:hypothetical protein